MIITPSQLGLLHHTLGLRPDQRTPFRNHFLAGQCHHDQSDLEALEAAGMMCRGRAPSFCDKDDIVFRVTEEGESYAIDNLPHPPKRTRYQQFMDDDYGHSFADWLGIDLPKFESNYRYGKDHRCRFVRRDYHGGGVVGEWAATKKDAKASYKAELKKHHDQLRHWRAA